MTGSGNARSAISSRAPIYELTHKQALDALEKVFEPAIHECYKPDILNDPMRKEQDERLLKYFRHRLENRWDDSDDQQCLNRERWKPWRKPFPKIFDEKICRPKIPSYDWEKAQSASEAEGSSRRNNHVFAYMYQGIPVAMTLISHKRRSPSKVKLTALLTHPLVAQAAEPMLEQAADIGGEKAQIFFEATDHSAKFYKEKLGASDLYDAEGKAKRRKSTEENNNVIMIIKAAISDILKQRNGYWCIAHKPQRYLISTEESQTGMQNRGNAVAPKS